MVLIKSINVFLKDFVKGAFGNDDVVPVLVLIVCLSFFGGFFVAVDSITISDSLLFAIIVSFIAAGVPAISAYYLWQHQEFVKSVKSKIDTTNTWTLKFNNAADALGAIKDNYRGNLNTHPALRVFNVMSIITVAEPIKLDIEDLTFLVPKTNDLEAQKIVSRDLGYINALLNNINLVLLIWRRRNKLINDFKREIYSKAKIEFGGGIGVKEIVKHAEPAELDNLIHMTEYLISRTDDLIIETSIFVKNFPIESMKVIGNSLVKKYGTIIVYDKMQEGKMELIERCIAVDLHAMSAITKMPLEEIKEMFGRKQA